MPDIYTSVPAFENERFILRFVQKGDANDLLAVYSDKNALPFFNSDNCHGDNFYYPTLDRMNQAVDFWLDSYKNKWFVRWSIIDKRIKKAIGSIELFHREADDAFDNVGLLRLDLRSDYEKANIIEEIANLILNSTYSLFYTDRIITKVPLYAVERQVAFTKLGFTKSEEYLIGTMDNYAYKDYWEKKI
ncbi:MAG: N-acetyltransferase [Spirochaetales bacterium]|nr:N-acetyltransferase [Spirochaetales bacterium]